MSKEIDERIVEMRFENSKFERNVSKTMSTLDELKEKLMFKKATDGIDRVQKSVNSLSFEHLVKTVDTINDRVTKMPTLWDGIIEGIGEKIASELIKPIEKLKSMLDQITFEPIMTGFSEYELKTNSVQVIAANTGVLMRDAMEEMGRSAESVTETFDAMEMAWDTMMGKYGNGEERVEALGDKYSQVQSLVNKMVAGEIKMGDSVESATEKLEEQIYTMQDIENVLENLNLYADKTIYNYAQMTDAIGQFTVQGVDLYDANTAVQGLANLAAFTGVDASGAARVMREAAKGLATGFIGLQDWMSFETTGGMGGKTFQEELMKTADKLWETDEAYREYAMNAAASANGLDGMLDETTNSISDFVAMQGKFRNSLKAGWLNDTVLIETLHKFAGDLTDAEYAARGYTEAEIADIQALGAVASEAATKSKTFTQMWDAVTEAAQSSWTTTWEYIFGHFYDARNLWTIVGDALSDVISANNEARNEVLKIWSETGGRTGFFNAIGHLFNFLMNIADSAKMAWSELFEPISGKQLTKLSGQFNKFTAALEKMEGIYNIVYLSSKILFTILKAGVIVFESLFKAIGTVLGLESGSDIIDTLTTIVMYIEYFVLSLVDLDTIGNNTTMFFINLLNVMKEIPKYTLLIIETVDELSKEFLGFSIVDEIKIAGEKISDFFKNIKSISTILSPFIDKIKNFFSGIKTKSTNAATDFFSSLNLPPTLGKTISTLAVSLVQILLVLQGIKSIKGIGKLPEIFTGIPSGVSDMIDSIKEAGESAVDLSKSGIIMSIAKAILLLAVSMGILALIPSDRLVEVTSTLILVMGMLMLFSKILGGVFDKLPRNAAITGASAIALLAASLATLVGSVVLLSILDYESATNALVIVGVLLLMVSALIGQFNHARFRNNLPQVAAAVFITAQAVSSLAILIAVMSIVARFNSSGMWQAFGLVTAIFVEMIVLYYVIVNAPFTGSGKKLIAVTGSIFLLVGAIAAVAAIMTIMASILVLFPDLSSGLILSFGILFGIITLIGLLALAFVGMSSIPALNVGGILAVSAAMAIIIGSLLGFVAALWALGEIQNAVGYETMWQHLLTLTGIISLMMLLIVSLRAIRPSQTVSLLAASLAINIIVMSILTLVQGVMLLSNFNLDDDKVNRILKIVGVVTIAMAVLMTVLALVSGIGGSGNTKNITKNFNLMFSSTSAIHKFLLGIAAIILAISISIWVLVDSLNNLMDAANKFAEDEYMPAKIAAMFEGFAKAFEDSWKYIAAAIDNSGISEDLDRWFKSFLDSLVDNIGYLLSALVVLVGVLAESIVDILIELLNGLTGTDLTTWYDVMGDGLTENMFDSFINSAEDAPINKLINAVVAFIALVIYGVGDAIINNAGPLVFAIGYLIAALVYLGYYISGMILQAFMPEIDMDTLNSYFSDFGQNFVDGWETTWTTVMKPGLQKIGNGLLLLLASIVYTPVKAFLSGINDIISGLNESLGFDLALWDTSGLDSWYGDLITKVGLIEEESEQAANTIDTMSESIQNFNNKMNELSGKNVESTVTLNPMFATNTDKLNRDLFTAGDNAGKESVKGFNNAWDIHSPSLVGEQSGTDIGAGVVNGISGYFKSPEAQEKLTGIKDALPKIDFSGMYDSATAEFDMNPSQVFNFNTEGMGDDLMQSGFGNVFSDMGLDIGNVSTDLANVNSSTQDMSDALANEGGKFYDDTEVINELSGLRDDLSVLSNAMTKIKMVLDSNKLIGELVGPLDTALAQRATRVHRGN